MRDRFLPVRQGFALLPVLAVLCLLAMAFVQPAYGEELTGEAYASYDSATTTLTFARADTAADVPAGTSANPVFTGFETKSYSYSKIPWKEVAATTTKVVFVDVIRPESLANWFYGFRKMKSIDFAKLDTSEATSMCNMFQNCSSLTALDVSGFETGKVKSMESMFDGCSGLRTMSIAGWDTSSVTNMFSMFASCLSLVTLDLSGLDTSNVVNMSVMLCDDESLVSVNFDGFDTQSVTDMHLMFYNCIELRELDLTSFDSSSIEENLSGSGFSGTYALFGYKNTETNPGLCRKLAKVVFGNSFTPNSDGLLPAPDPAYISGADGAWHDETGQALKPKEVASRGAGTYYAVPTAASAVDISNAVVTAPDQAENGGGLCPAASVVLDGTPLRLGVDYELTYLDNRDAGTAYVVASGLGAYTGIAIGSFQIAAGEEATGGSQPQDPTVTPSEDASELGQAVSVKKGTAKKVTINKKRASAKMVRAAAKKGATTIVLGKKVRVVSARAFKGTKVTRVVVKSKHLKTKKSVKGCLKGSKVKKVTTPNKKVRAAFKKYAGKKSCKVN